LSVSESGHPPPDAPGAQGETKPLPKLERPATGPVGFNTGGHPLVAPPHLASHPTPPLGHVVAKPYQSQPVPPMYPQQQQQQPPQQPPPYGPPKTGTQPAPPMNAMATGPHQILTPGHGMKPQGVPTPPGSNPRMGGNTGTIPAMTAAQPAGSQPQPQGPYTRHHTGTAPRITVQYPQVGGTLKGQRGSYTVLSTIGSGEFGAVYECIGPFDQIYALKMVRPSNRPYSEVQAEWAREQSRLFSLRHPNVVYIYDSFEQDHLFYLALERCDHALKDMLGTPMQEGLVLEMTRQLLAAVQFLHDNEVVHDDLHAGNVLITHTDRPTVKISDFGISHELRGMTAVRPNVVHHAIMAPEILATGYTSRQSDLYQVGLLLYWMLAGEPAIQMDVPYQELVRQVADGAPRLRAEQLGTPFGDLIAKMLRRREAFRYGSAREVWSELRELPAWKQRNLFPVK
jgi:eukaryotic-like serine/threonine-protein kinase